jgi:predicted permease
MRSNVSRLPYVLRKLRGSPVFTGVSIVTLGIGIGANTAIFSVVNGVLLKPLPYRDPSTLIGVWHEAPGLGFDEVNMSPALYFTYREEGGRVFEDIGMWSTTEVSVTGQGEPAQVPGMMVTDGTLSLLGVSAAHGRVFTTEDDQPDSPLTVLLSWSYWQRQFGGDPGAVGKTLRINGREREIIGVLPRDFRLLDRSPDLYLPYQFNRSELFVGNFSYQSIARLRPGATIAQADAEIERLVPLAVERFPGNNTLGVSLNMLREARFGANTRPLKQDVVGDVGNVLWILLGTVGLVLLIACANIANLFLVRAEARQREIAIRMAMGASRGRLASQLLRESVVLGMMGGVLGLVLAFAGLRLLVSIAPDTLPRAGEIGLDPLVLLFTAGLSVLAGLLFGMFPVLRLRAAGLSAVLKEGGRGSSAGKERHRLRGAIATAEVALALVLLVGAGLMVRSFQALRDVNPGFQRPEEVLTVRVPVPTAEVADPTQVALIYEQIYEQLRAINGVSSVGVSWITMSGYNSNDPIYAQDHPTPPDQLPPIRRFKWMAGEWFETMGNPVLAGRSITWSDIHNRSRVVMITENLAREYWQEPSAALGKRVRVSPTQPWREIVGVVGNERDDGVGEEPPSIVYYPLVVDSFYGTEVFVQRSMDFALRVTRPDPKSILPEVRQAVASVNSNLPLAGVRTLDEVLARSMARTSFTLVMLGIAATVALVLGIVGVYGVIAYIVSQRTREIGVRLALGASRADIRRLVVSQGAMYAGMGTSIGLLAAFGVTRLMRAVLYGVSAADPLAYAAGAVVIGSVSLLASWLPALRAASIDPNQALRRD